MYSPKRCRAFVSFKNVLKYRRQPLLASCISLRQKIVNIIGSKVLSPAFNGTINSILVMAKFQQIKIKRHLNFLALNIFKFSEFKSAGNPTI